MIEPARIPPVGASEIVERYVLYRRHVRADQTVKPDAFIPPPDRMMSVTRHYLATEAELWQVGQNVASARGRTLEGRADVGAEVIRGQNLDLVPDPIPDNPNHANVTQWPADKAAQKILAAELAKQACFRPWRAPGNPSPSQAPPNPIPP